MFGFFLWLKHWLRQCSFHFDQPLPFSKHPHLLKPASCQMRGRVTPTGRFPAHATLHCSFSQPKTSICSLCKGSSHPSRQSSADLNRLFGRGERNKKSIGSLKGRSTHRLCAPGRSLSVIRQQYCLILQDKVKAYRRLTYTSRHFSRP